MTQPNCPKQRIISLLVQEKLSGMTESCVRFTVFIDIRGNEPAPRGVVKVENCAFTDVYKETYIFLASKIYRLVVSRRRMDGMFT